MKKILLFFIILQFSIQITSACTGIALKSKDGVYIPARTVEWGSNDMMIKIGIFPSNKEYIGTTPDGENGKKWKGKYGFVGMTSYGQPFVADGMNEKGLTVGMFYLPGFASYNRYDVKDAEKSFSVGDLTLWILSSFTTCEEVKSNLSSVKVVNVEDKRFGGAPLPFHWRISDKNGKSIVIEIINNGKITVFDAPLGVISNSPTYDWHLTNLRNYLKLSPIPVSPLKIDKSVLSALGAGSGMIGLPGDYTPPSRFVRAAAFTSSARPLENAEDAVSEAFRILNNFDIPVGSILPKEHLDPAVHGSTQFTSAADTKKCIYYFHTQFTPRIRKIDLKKIDFASLKEFKTIEVEKSFMKDVEELIINK